MHSRAWFFIKCIVASCFVMCASMVAGEMLISKNLFGGFSLDPQMWMWVVIETCLWITPFALLGLALHSLFRRYFKDFTFLFSNLIWAILALMMVVLYCLTYVTKPWHMRDLNAGTVFGWVIPSALICLLFGKFSKDLYES